MVCLLVKGRETQNAGRFQNRSEACEEVFSGDHKRPSPALPHENAKHADHLGSAQQFLENNSVVKAPFLQTIPAGTWPAQ